MIVQSSIISSSSEQMIAISAHSRVPVPGQLASREQAKSAEM